MNLCQVVVSSQYWSETHAKNGNKTMHSLKNNIKFCYFVTNQTFAKITNCNIFQEM